MSTVSAAYLDKVRFGVRRTSGTMVDAELTDIVQQCRADLIRMGVEQSVAEDETDVLVLGCVRCFARWQFGINGDNSDRNHADYLELADNLRRSQTEVTS